MVLVEPTHLSAINVIRILEFPNDANARYSSAILKELAVPIKIMLSGNNLDLLTYRCCLIDFTKDMMTDAIIPLERHSSLYRDTRQKLYLEISRMSGFDIKTIQSINISPAGILTIQYPDRQASLNLIERWNTLLLPQDEKNNIQS